MNPIAASPFAMFADPAATGVLGQADAGFATVLGLTAGTPAGQIASGLPATPMAFASQPMAGLLASASVAPALPRTAVAFSPPHSPASQPARAGITLQPALSDKPAGGTKTPAVWTSQPIVALMTEALAATPAVLEPGLPAQTSTPAPTTAVAPVLVTKPKATPAPRMPAPPVQAAPIVGTPVTTVATTAPALAQAPAPGVLPAAEEPRDTVESADAEVVRPSVEPPVQLATIVPAAPAPLESLAAALPGPAKRGDLQTLVTAPAADVGPDVAPLAESTTFPAARESGRADAPAASAPIATPVRATSPSAPIQAQPVVAAPAPIVSEDDVPAASPVIADRAMPTAGEPSETELPSPALSLDPAPADHGDVSAAPSAFVTPPSSSPILGDSKPDAAPTAQGETPVRPAAQAPSLTTSPALAEAPPRPVVTAARGRTSERGSKTEDDTSVASDDPDDSKRDIMAPTFSSLAAEPPTPASEGRAPAVPQGFLRQGTAPDATPQVVPVAASESPLAPSAEAPGAAPPVTTSEPSFARTVSSPIAGDLRPAAAPGADPALPAFTPAAVPDAPLARAAESPAVQHTATARPGLIGHEMGVAIARHVLTDGGDAMTVRLTPADMGRIEITLSFDDSGTLRAVMAADSPAALDMLRRDSADLGRALTDAGVRSDGASLRFDTRSSDGGGNGGSAGQFWQRRQDARAGNENADVEPSAQTNPTYRPLRTSGRVDMIA